MIVKPCKNKNRPKTLKIGSKTPKNTEFRLKNTEKHPKSPQKHRKTPQKHPKTPKMTLKTHPKSPMSVVLTLFDLSMIVSVPTSRRPIRDWGTPVELF
jgi:hypothetical protein